MPLRRVRAKASLRVCALGLCALLASACAGTTPAPETGSTPLAAAYERGARVAIVDARLWGASGDALLIEGDRIVDVGDSDAILARDPHQVIDARGAWVLPGLHDSHAHLLGGGLASLGVELALDMNLEAVLAAVKAHADAHPEADWIVGRGWAYDVVALGAYPTRAQLDAVVSERPVVLRSYDEHAVWANTRALQLAGIDASTPDPTSGKVVREANGTPAGVLLEDAMELLNAVVPTPTAEQQRAALQAACAHLLSLGVTHAVDIVEGGELALYEDLLAHGELPMRITVAPSLYDDLDAIEAARQRLQGPWLRIGFVKAFIDGVIESKTALMLAPYATDDGRGTPNVDPAAFAARVQEAHRRGLQVGVHAIGDGGVRVALDAFAQAQVAHPRSDPRHRLEHIEVIDEADVPRLARLGVVASMQPYHALPGDDPTAGAWAQNLGPERHRRAMPWRLLLDAGASLAFGSDWPVMSPNPWWGMAVAATRQNERGLPLGGWQPSLRISLDEAVRAYTEAAAHAVFREYELGRIAPGMLADLVVLTPKANLAEPSGLWLVEVQHTLVGGVVRYSRR